MGHDATANSNGSGITKPSLKGEPSGNQLS
jgi:hypothetical protein